MAGEFAELDEEYQKKKKTVFIIGAILIVLLGGTLIVGQGSGLIRTTTPSPSAVAVVTRLPPSTVLSPTVIPTATSLPIDTVSPPTVTPQPPTPTLSPSPTPEQPTSTPTPSPSPTPQPPTSTPTPTPTLTATPIPPRAPNIENPADGSQLPGDALRIDGTAEPRTTVQVYEGDTSLGEASVDENGRWSLVPVELLPAGDHTIVAVDIVTGEASAPVTFALLEAWLPITGGVTISTPQR